MVRNATVREEHPAEAKTAPLRAYLHPDDRARAADLRAERITQVEYVVGLQSEKPGFPSFLTELDDVLIAAYDAEITGEQLPFRTRFFLARRRRAYNREFRARQRRISRIQF